MKNNERKELTLGVVGLGYVGLPLSMEFVRSGYRTIGFDIDRKKVDMLNKGKTYLKHIGENRVKEMMSGKLFTATTDFSRVKEIDSISICVPTPLDEHMMPDLSFVIESVSIVSENMKKGALVILESTTYPGTTREDILPILKRGGKEIDRDFFLAYSPEREDPGNRKYTTKNIPKVVGGVTEESTRKAVELYDTIFDTVVEVSSADVAEATKILENTYRAINIALVNELKMIFDRMGINIWEVIDAADTKPFGFTAFYPGPGLGGHCIPIDPFYLSWKARELGINTRFIELAGEINTAMPEYVVRKTMSALNEYNKSIKDSNILVIGVAYKKDIDDTRESPGIRILELLIERGANVKYFDPFIPEISKLRQTKLTMKSVELSDTIIREQDAIVIATAHSDINYKKILQGASLIIDTRNAFSGFKSNKITIS